jgi:hypothetical protein
MKGWLDILQVNLLCDEGARDEDGDLDRLTLPKVAFEALGHEVSPSKTKLLLMGKYEVGPPSRFPLITYDIDTNEMTKLGSVMPGGIVSPNMKFVALADNRIIACSAYTNIQPGPMAYIFDPFHQDGLVEHERMSDEDCRQFACRGSASLVILHDGRVMRIGGWTLGLGQAESALYDPTTKKWIAAPSVTKMPAHAFCVVLQDGRVLITGGFHAGFVVSACWMYDPRTGEFTQVADMFAPRSGHVGCLLDSGDVFICGGNSINGNRIFRAEIYDIAKGVWRTLDHQPTPTAYQSCLEKTNGDIFLVSFSSGFTYSISDGMRPNPVSLIELVYAVAIN